MSNSGSGDPHEDIGPPLASLAGYDADVSSGFWSRLHRRIERRAVVSQAADFWWNGPLAVLIAFLDLVFGLAGRAPDDRQPRG